MKTKLIALALFGTTAATIAAYGLQPEAVVSGSPPSVAVALPAIDPITQSQPRIEVVFVLDTTGSMSGLIQAAKEKIWSIASTMAQAEGAPEIRMGLVAYRDRGDQYVTRIVDLSDDLDSVHATLMDFDAGGGGDGPESVNQALYDSIHELSWSHNPDTYRAVFLVGDAPPHMDYQDDVKYPETLSIARKKGIVVNAIQCGQGASTEREWQRIAGLGDGDYFHVSQDGGAIAIVSPYDDALARLSAEMDETRLFYGSEEQKVKMRQKSAAADKLHASSSVASQARRAAFNASDSGKANLLGKQELVEDVASGRVDLDAIDEEHLPEPFKAMTPGERKAVVAENAGRRTELKKEIQALADKRDTYLQQKVAEAGEAEDSLDHKIYQAVREQAAAVGLSYEAAAPSY